MAIKFFSDDILYKNPIIETSSSILGDIDNSASVSGVELRLLPPYIKDNKTEPFLFFPGKASLYCLVIVVGDADNQLIGGIDLQGFPRIGDHEYLPINKTIYYWQSADLSSKSPNQIHVFCSVVKSKKGLREAGEIMSQIKDDSDYKSIAGQIASMASKATPVTAALDLITSIAKVAGKYLKNVEDKPIGSIVNSYTTLHGDFDKLGINKHKYTTTNVDFEFELTVRDKKREQEIKSSVLGASVPKKQASEAIDVEMTPIK